MRNLNTLLLILGSEQCNAFWVLWMHLDIALQIYCDVLQLSTVNNWLVHGWSMVNIQSTQFQVTTEVLDTFHPPLKWCYP